MVLRDFNGHAEIASSKQALDLVSSMAILGVSQIVSGPTHQASHTLHLVFGMGINVNLIAPDRVPCFFALNVLLNTSPTPSLGGKWIYVHLVRLMDPISFQNAL